MRTVLSSLTLSLLLATGLRATPPDVTTVDEALAGANQDSYAVLRTETDNHGSYYKSQRKVFLDERSKDGKTTLKSTLILDVITVIDASHNDTTKPPGRTEEILTKDDSISLAEIQRRFPLQAKIAWADERIAKINSAPKDSGIRDNDLLLVDARRISGEVFGGRHEGEEWKVTAASEDFNTIYLTITTGPDSEEPETRLICIPPQAKRQMEVHMLREQVYLVAGTYDKKEQAWEQAKKWIETHGTKPGALRPQVWSLPRSSQFVVVAEGSMDLMRHPGGVRWLGKELGIEFEPVPGDVLGEYMEIPRDP